MAVSILKGALASAALVSPGTKISQTVNAMIIPRGRGSLMPASVLCGIQITPCRRVPSVHEMIAYADVFVERFCALGAGCASARTADADCGRSPQSQSPFGRSIDSEGQRQDGGGATDQAGVVKWATA